MCIRDSLTGVDTITDFARGTDKIQLLVDQYTSLTGGITNANVRVLSLIHI